MRPPKHMCGNHCEEAFSILACAFGLIFGGPLFQDVKAHSSKLQPIPSILAPDLPFPFWGMHFTLEGFSTLYESYFFLLFKDVFSFIFRPFSLQNFGFRRHVQCVIFESILDRLRCVVSFVDSRLLLAFLGELYPSPAGCLSNLKLSPFHFQNSSIKLPQIKIKTRFLPITTTNGVIKLGSKNLPCPAPLIRNWATSLSISLALIQFGRLYSSLI